MFTLLPIEGAAYVIIDPSTPDLTGRTIEFLGNDAGFTKEHPSIKKAVSWLKKQQKEDGSWKGRWGISYIYGTWAAVTGMAAVGVSPTDLSIQRAVQWLLNRQNTDGGWGESCRSDREERYIPLYESTPSQTAWALDVLIAVSDEPLSEIDRGIKRLIHLGKRHDWTTEYPTGAGLPGDVYFHYKSYQYIWPLLTLGHYQNKFILKK